MNNFDSMGVISIPLLSVATMIASPIPSDVFEYLEKNENGGISLIERIDDLTYRSAGITFNSEDELARQFIEFADKFISSQKELDDDDMRLLEEHFWDLV